MEKMTHDYIRQTIPEEISERGGALLRLVGGKTVPPETHELEIATVDGAPAVTNPFDTPLHAGLTGLITMENADVLGELAFVPEE